MQRVIEAIFLAALTFGFLYFAFNALLLQPREKIMLLETGRKAGAIFYDSHWSGDGPSTCIYGFYVEHKPYNGYFTCEDFPYQFGDTLQILYSVNNPGNNILQAEAEQPFIKNLSAFFKKSKFLHHAFFEKDTI